MNAIPSDTITCPKCSRSGSVSWDVQSPGVKNEHMRSEIQELSEGFAALDRNGRDNLQIICQTCRTTVERAEHEHELEKKKA